LTRMTIEVNQDIVIPDGDYSLSFVRDPGRAARTSTKWPPRVQLRFDLQALAC